MKQSQGATCPDSAALRSPLRCPSRSSSSTRGRGHSLLLLQLRNELEGKWRPDKFGILRRWMNSPKHWKEDAYEYAYRPGVIMRSVRRSVGGGDVQKRVRNKQKPGASHKSKATLIERFVQQVSPNDEAQRSKQQKRVQRFWLEEEIMILQKRLKKEVELRLALEEALKSTKVASLRRYESFPTKARELLQDVATLENVVKALEAQSTALRLEIGQERKFWESIEGGCSFSQNDCTEEVTNISSKAVHSDTQSRGVSRGRSSVTSSSTHEGWHSERPLKSKRASCKERFRIPSATSFSQPSSRGLQSRCSVETAGRSTFAVPSSSKSRLKENGPSSPRVLKSRALNGIVCQELSSCTVSSNVSSKHSFLSAFDPHNRVQSSAALLQTVSASGPFSLSPATLSNSGTSSPDHSDSFADPDSSDRDNTSSLPDSFQLPTSCGSTPEHRFRPSSPALGATEVLGLRCDDALPTEEMYSLKHLSRKFLPPPEIRHSSSGWGSCASDEFLTPKTSSSGIDHLSAESQPSSLDKRSKVRVQLSFDAEDNPLSHDERQFPGKACEETVRRQLMCELMSPRVKLDTLPVRGHCIQLENRFRDYSRTPNRLAKEMVKCMVSIYWHLADPAVMHRKRSSCDKSRSPTSHIAHATASSLSSFSESSLLSFGRSPLVDRRSKDDLLGNDRCDPYRAKDRIPWVNIGLYAEAVEVSWMSVSTDQLGYAAQSLHRFRLLVEELPNVDLRRMSHSQKLAFWLNLYNSLMMHAYLAYGIPRNELKYFALLQKASYNVGGQSFNAATIEFSLLRGEIPSFRPQIRLLLALHRSTWTLSEDQNKFAIDYPEPQVVFALCCGAHSSPAVRLYTAERVHQELNVAMKDYVRATVGLNGRGKLLVPKLLYTYAQDFVDDGGILDWICQFLPSNQAELVLECWQQRQNLQVNVASFAVLPFELDFRYMFHPSFNRNGGGDT